ncbi:FtsL-like putative cell division protein [Bacteroidia bacterium]|nr:FtsL-like putative cell division protein [Bacteroidia bacterium]
MAKQKKSIATPELRIPAEWINYLLFLFVVALLYIYLSHRTDNIVRDIEATKRSLVEKRAENITLKSELMQQRSRESLEERLAERGVKEPNRAVKVIRKQKDD